MRAAGGRASEGDPSTRPEPVRRAKRDAGEIRPQNGQSGAGPPADTRPVRAAPGWRNAAVGLITTTLEAAEAVLSSAALYCI